MCQELSSRPQLPLPCLPQIAWRYSCLYFYERSYESYGKLFDKVSDLMVRVRTLVDRGEGARGALPSFLKLNCPTSMQVWVLVIFVLFTAFVLASKKQYAAPLIMLVTQLPGLYLFHK